MPICGIYKITNQINGKCYIGQSVNIAKRWTEYRCKATSKGSEGFESHFYRSIRKYGLENFSFEILEECLREELNKKEQFYIAKYHSDQQDYGYNLTPGGDSQGPTTRKLTDKQVEEIFSLLDNSDLSQTEVRQESFLSLSRKYKVSDNAIRKWCKAYNLPSKSSVIKSYSDEEWNEI